MTTILALAAVAPAFQATTINAYLQPNFHDATFTAKVVSKDEAELQKINDDFGKAYKVGYVNVRLAEPFKMRLDSNIEDTKVSYVINGDERHFKIPRLGINKREDLSHKPGSRQTVFDYGVLTPSLFESFLDASFVRIDRATGDAVFDITYKPIYNDKTRYRVWLDPKTHLVAKREWYHRKGRFVATFLYENPVQVNGAWMPTQLTVKNADDKVGGVTRYDDVKINQGIPDNIFS